MSEIDELKAENEQLRAVLEHKSNAMQQQLDEIIAALQAENERLRAALALRDNAIAEAVEIANIDFPQSQMNAAAWELKHAIDQIADIIQVDDSSAREALALKGGA